VTDSALKSQVRPLIPRSGETLFCNTLVVGETLAAYTAVLAILRQGGTVCWVTATEGLPTLTQGALMPEIAAPQGPQALGAVLWGNRYRLPPAGYLSQSQWDFWQRSQQRPAATPPLLAENAGTASPDSLPLPALQQAIAPKLNWQGLTLISQARPTRVLLSQTDGQQRVYQVSFRRRQTPFRIHSPLTLDATSGATLSRYLEQALELQPPDTLPMAINLTAAHRQPRQPRSARGTCFPDAIGVLPAGAPPGAAATVTPDRAKAERALTVPLRSLIPQGVQGWLRVTQPPGSGPLASWSRVPATQWMLGEGAGCVAWMHQHTGQPCLTLATQPRWRRRLQRQLVQAGIPLFPFDDVDPDDPDFVAIQGLAVAGIVCTTCDRDLHFRPQTPVTYGMAATALGRLLGWQAADPDTNPAANVVPRTHWAWGALVAAIVVGKLPLAPEEWPYPNRVLSRQTLAQWVRQHLPPDATLPHIVEDDAPARRRDLSRLLYGLWQSQATIPE
jgi:hypothetical protein